MTRAYPARGKLVDRPQAHARGRLHAERPARYDSGSPFGLGGVRITRIAAAWKFPRATIACTRVRS